MFVLRKRVSVLLFVVGLLSACIVNTPGVPPVPPTPTPVPSTATPHPTSTPTPPPTPMPSPTAEPAFQGALTDLLCTANDFPFQVRLYRENQYTAEDTLKNFPDSEKAQAWLRATGFEEGHSRVFSVPQAKRGQPWLLLCGAERYATSQGVQTALKQPLWAKHHGWVALDVPRTIGDSTTIWQAPVPDAPDFTSIIILFAKHNIGYGLTLYYPKDQVNLEQGWNLAEHIYQTHVANAFEP